MGLQQLTDCIVNESPIPRHSAAPIMPAACNAAPRSCPLRTLSAQWSPAQTPDRWILQTPWVATISATLVSLLGGHCPHAKERSDDPSDNPECNRPMRGDDGELPSKEAQCKVCHDPHDKQHP